VKVEAEQKIQVDEIFVDDGAAGIQSVMEAASSAVVSLLGVTTNKTVRAVVPKKPKAKKLSPSKRKRWPQKRRNLVHQVTTKQNGTVEVLGENRKINPQLANWGNYARRTAITVLTNKKKNAVFTLQRCKMLVDIGLVPLHFYQYGSDDSDEVGEHQDSTRRNAKQTLTESTSTVTQSLEAITMNMTQFVKMAKDKNQNIEEDQYIQD
jgi:hypothetical protein